MELVQQQHIGIDLCACACIIMIIIRDHQIEYNVHFYRFRSNNANESPFVRLWIKWERVAFLSLVNCISSNNSSAEINIGQCNSFKPKHNMTYCVVYFGEYVIASILMERERVKCGFTLSKS